jgi:hypothetical protein
MAKYVLVVLLLLISIPTWGQNPQSDTILVNSTPPITQKMVDAYTNFYEWHFELRLNPEQRQKFHSFLIEDLKKGKLAKEVVEKTRYMDEFKKKSWIELFKAHSDLKQIDLIDSATNHSLNGKGSDDITDSMIRSMGGVPPDRSKIEEKIHGNGTFDTLRKSAKSGDRSSDFLVKTNAEYQKPIIGDGSIYTSLFKRDIDAAFEWTTFRMIMVAGKRVAQGDQTERALMEQRIIKTWNDNKSDPEKIAKLKGWLNSMVNEWLMWRGAEYSIFARYTPFGKKEQLVRWGQEIIGFVPEMKTYLDQRIIEYKDYVAKMPNDEVKREYELKEKSNTEFRIAMQKIQNDMKATSQTFAVMREGLRNLHVANLNIAENIGNTGFVWQMKTIP